MAISGPIALYNNLPINFNGYRPKTFEISSITKGETTTVVTDVANDFVVGQIIRFHIPKEFGIRQLDEMQGLVIAINSTTEFVVDIDSTSFDSYVAAVSTQAAYVSPIGDMNTGQINSSRTNQLTYIPGSFINIT